MNQDEITDLLKKLDDLKEGLTKEIHEYQRVKDDNTVADRDKADRKRTIQSLLEQIDAAIVEDENVRNAMLNDDSSENLIGLIGQRMDSALLELFTNAGFTTKGKSVSKIVQLTRTKGDTLFEQRYNAAKKLYMESKKYGAYKKLLEKVKDPKAEIKGIDIGTNIKRIEELDGALGYNFIEYMEKMSDNQRTTVGNEMNVFLNHLKSLKGTDADIEIEIDGNKVKVSELNIEQLKGRNSHRANVFKKILKELDANKIKNAFIKGRQEQIEEIKKNILGNKALGFIEIDDGQGVKRNALKLLRAVLEKPDVNLDEVNRILAEVKKDENLQQLDQLAATDPEKYKGARKAYEELEKAKQAGYTGKAVGEYRRTGIDLGFLGADTNAAASIDFANLDKDKIDEVSEGLFKEYFSNPSKERIEIAEKSIIAELGPNVKVPRNIFFFSALKRLFGFKTARQKFFENAISNRIKQEVISVSSPEYDKEERAAHDIRKKSWELTQAQEAKFRQAEIKIILENNEEKADDVVRTAAKDEVNQGR